MTNFFKAGLIVMSLFIIPGLVLQVHAQYDIPDIPSQEDIEKMMPKEVSGTYTNQDYQVSVDFPSGWSGMVSEFNNPETGTPITTLQVMEGGIEANMDALEKGEFAMIMLTIVGKTDEKTPPEPESPNEDYEGECSYIVAEKTTLDGKNGMKLEAQCPGANESMKMLAYHYATTEKIVMYAYTTSPSSDFDTHLDKFEDSVKTLSIKNLVDISYEIPDEMMRGSDEATDEDIEEVMMDDTDETTDEDIEEIEVVLKKVMSPRMQLKSGVATADIVCNEGKELLVKASTGLGTCVKSSSV